MISGVSPVWSRDGRELFFLNAKRQMTVVAFPPGAAARPGAERTLFTLADDHFPHARSYFAAFDVSPDGQRFNSGMGTDFLQHLSEIASAALGRLR